MRDLIYNVIKYCDWSFAW